MIISLDPGLPFYALALMFALGCSGLYLAWRFMAEDAAQQWRYQYQTQVRIGVAVVLAILFAVVIHAAPMMNPCAEETLRAVYGDNWQIWWWLNGCFLM